MSWYVITLVLFGYFLGEFIIGFFFNYKITCITKNDYKTAALMGFVSTFLFALLMGSAAVVSVLITPNESGSGLRWMNFFFIPAALMMGLGNYASTFLIPKFTKHGKDNNG